MPTAARRAHARPRRPERGPWPPLEYLETTVRDWLSDPVCRGALTLTRTGPGRPPVLPALVLWAGLLLCLLRGFDSVLELWRLLTVQGLWDFPRVDVGDTALYARLERTPATALEQFFLAVTQQLHARFVHPPAVRYAAFATEIFALDQTVLDALLRKLKLLRGLRKGDQALLPGVLACRFDLRRQQWAKVTYSTHALQNEKPGAPDLVADVPPGSLLLFDLGYFSFFWLDYLTEQHLWYVSRLRAGVSMTELHVLYHGSRGSLRLRERLVYLGKHDQDRAAHPVRLIEVTSGDQTWQYLTNVLDPRVLPAWEVVGLYGYRWDIETAFNVLKTHFKLHLLASGHRQALLQQVFATLTLSQIVLGLRFELAAQAGCDVREISLELMLRWLPRLGKEGRDPLAEFVRVGRKAGFIRPFRGRERPVLQPAATDYTWPEHPPPARPPRYGSAPRTALAQRQMDTLRARYTVCRAKKAAAAP